MIARYFVELGLMIAIRYLQSMHAHLLAFASWEIISDVFTFHFPSMCECLSCHFLLLLPSIPQRNRPIKHRLTFNTIHSISHKVTMTLKLEGVACTHVLQAGF